MSMRNRLAKQLLLPPPPPEPSRRITYPPPSEILVGPRRRSRSLEHPLEIESTDLTINHMGSFSDVKEFTGLDDTSIKRYDIAEQRYSVEKPLDEAGTSGPRFAGSVTPKTRKSTTGPKIGKTRKYRKKQLMKKRGINKRKTNKRRK